MLSTNVFTRGAMLVAVLAMTPISAHADSAAIEQALRAAHPLFAQAQWSEASGEGSVPDLRGEGTLATRASAQALRLVLPWRGSIVTADSVHVVGEDLLLEGLRLENPGGLAEARRALLTREGLAAIGHLLSGEAPSGEGADADNARADGGGEIRLAGFSIETARRARERRDGTNGRFLATMRGEWLALSGIEALGRVNPTLALSGVAAERVVGTSVFAGEAGFTLERLDARLTGDSPVMGLVQEAMLRALGTSDGIASGALSLVMEGFDLTVTGRNARAEPVRMKIGRASVEGELAADGATRVALALREAAATPNIAGGTPLEGAMRMAARQAQADRAEASLLSGEHVPADVDLSASLDGREIVLDLDSRIPGLIETVAALDATLPEGGLAKLSGGGRDAAMALVLETSARTIRLDVVDRGLDAILAEETGERLVERLRGAMGAAGNGEGGGMRGMALQLALAQAASVLEILEEEGSLRMQVSSPVALPLPVALVTLLQSAGPVPPTR